MRWSDYGLSKVMFCQSKQDLKTTCTFVFISEVGQWSFWLDGTNLNPTGYSPLGNVW